MSVFSGEQGKKQAFLVVLPGKLDLENSPLMLGSPLPSVGGFHIIAGKFDSISKSCIQVSWLTGYRSLNGRGVGSSGGGGGGPFMEKADPCDGPLCWVLRLALHCPPQSTAGQGLAPCL